MERLNCLRCAYRHEDNGNCTAAGGFCTAVPAAHCRLLQEYLDTGLSPRACAQAAEIEAGLNESGYSMARWAELMAADKDGRIEALGECDGCKWRGRHQKCSCCRRNRSLKDCYEEDAPCPNA